MSVILRQRTSCRSSYKKEALISVYATDVCCATQRNVCAPFISLKEPPGPDTLRTYIAGAWYLLGDAVTNLLLRSSE